MLVKLEGKHIECTYDYKREEWWLVIRGVVLKVKVKARIRYSRGIVQSRMSDRWEEYKKDRVDDG